MRDHLFQSLLLAESRFPNCALIVAGDFNRLDVKSIQRHFRLKQIVKKPTRKNAILDLVLTNMHGFYADPQQFPPFRLSDHHTVTVEAKERAESRQAQKFVVKRDKRESRRAELGRYFDTMALEFFQNRGKFENRHFGRPSPLKIDKNDAFSFRSCWLTR